MGRRVAEGKKKGKGKTLGDALVEAQEAQDREEERKAEKEYGKAQSAKSLSEIVGGKTEKDYFKLVRDGLKDYVQISDMEDVQVVPTILTGYNRATGIGGHPLSRMMIVHGSNQVGKSGLALSILESLARAGFPCQNLDSEYAAEKRWYNHICKTPGIMDKPVGDIDEAQDDLVKALTNVEKLHRERKMPKEIGAAFVIDTLTKLMPRDILELVKKEGISKQYPIQALYVSTMMKVIIPMLGRTSSALVIVLQERQNMNAKGPFDKKWRITLGDALQYDNCLRVRVCGSTKVKEKEEVVGMQCHCEVANNKIDGTTYANFSFFTANGSGDCPIGLDLVMEAAEEARERGWLKVSKAGAVLDIPGVGDAEYKNFPDAVKHMRLRKDHFDTLVEQLNADSVRKVKEEEDD